MTSYEAPKGCYRSAMGMITMEIPGYSQIELLELVTMM